MRSIPLALGVSLTSGIGLAQVLPSAPTDRVAISGQVIGSGEVLASALRPVVDRNGEVAFVGGTATDSQGRVFLWSGGQLSVVIRDSDLIPGTATPYTPFGGVKIDDSGSMLVVSSNGYF